MAEQDPKESRPLMLRRSQWQALHGLAKAHGCAPGDIVGARIEVHLKNSAPKLEVHLGRLRKTAVTTEQRIRQYCEEHGIGVRFKHPWKTSQCCNVCLKWDRRNRQGDRFRYVSCGHADHADFNAARNLRTLEVVGAYGLGILKSNGYV